MPPPICRRPHFFGNLCGLRKTGFALFCRRYVSIFSFIWFWFWFAHRAAHRRAFALLLFLLSFFRLYGVAFLRTALGFGDAIFALITLRKSPVVTDPLGRLVQLSLRYQRRQNALETAGGKAAATGEARVVERDRAIVFVDQRNYCDVDAALRR